MVGSSISDFALGIWVYTSSGSVFQFALISLAFVVPKLLVSPFAGVMVDRWNRRTVMILSDAVHALLMGSVLLILQFGTLQSWHLYLITALAAVASSFQWPAYQALIPQLVPQAKLGSANGLIDLAFGIAQLAAPLGGGLLLVWIDLRGIVLIDLITFFVALFALLLVRVPDLVGAAATTAAITNWRAEFLEGWTFIRHDRGLLGLMLYIAVTVFLTGFVHVLTPPLVLSFASEAALGLILTVGGIGLLSGGLLMSIWGGPRPRIYGLLLFDLLAIAAMLLAGFFTSTWVLALVAFLFFVGLPISRSSAQSIWQSKVPLHLQGRVFVTRDMLAIGATPLAFLAAGPLADYLFEPLLQPNGALATSAGLWFGVGAGRGVALIFFCLGLCFLITNLCAWWSPTLRKVETN
jgi:predicted MFS family arabinose efflux permease